MDLNTFGAEMVKQLSRIADALENSGSSDASKADTKSAAADAPEEKKTTTTRRRRSAAASKEDATAKPKHTRDEVNAALIALKDDCGKEYAQEVIRNAGYTKMAEIEEKDFDAVYEAAKAKVEEMSNGNLDDDDEGDI